MVTNIKNIEINKSVNLNQTFQKSTNNKNLNVNEVKASTISQISDEYNLESYSDSLKIEDKTDISWLKTFLNYTGAVIASPFTFSYDLVNLAYNKANGNEYDFFTKQMWDNVTSANTKNNTEIIPLENQIEEKQQDSNIDNEAKASEGNINITDDNRIHNKIYYYQKDYKEPYGDGTIIDPMTGQYATIAEYGCAPTSMAMVISSILDKEVNPVEVNKILFEHGGCTERGTDVEKVSEVLEEYNLNAIRTGDTKKAYEMLDSGEAMVIVSLGPGHFTNSGHYIVLCSTGDDNTVFVYDPYDKDRCIEWPYDIVCSEMFLDNSMWIVSK